MLELASALLPLLDAGHHIAVATVTRIDGSAPRTLATSMALVDSGAVIGSISGGCVEGAVYEACAEVLETGRASVQQFGYSDDDAFAVGLACGGRIEVIVQRIGGAVDERDDALQREFAAAAEGRPAGIAMIVEGDALGAVLVGGHEPSEFVGVPVDSANRLRAELAARISAGQSGLAVVECDDAPIKALFVVAATAPRMIIFGAVDFSAALAQAAVLLGYRVTICDARPVFATAERFPAAHDVVVEWPSDYLARTEVDARTVVCVLTHDDKFDIPLLEVALGLPIAYVGAMGSRRTHERRLEALCQTVDSDALERLHSPIGLDIGASTPEETALSILAEVVATRTAASGGSLRYLAGPIHGAAAKHS
ncbi:XdhC family protein [Subtercola vilae]|uniref:XdhC/CoxI family protein n=2 Tax=Subtercola TaxID=120212 RepID=A0A4T2C1W6_9MICO|nr:XdhC/CoxI family protein [Subtercola vilae]TIH38235.1 XdhC/CoxI family protein [Subtercola vilae]